ncbi:rod shape-determining protein MreC [Candidatus Chromulinivorax destructor]|uniref:Cell shape-determining protein MreC n=1 Tax=Candidatus Chromulinivorax destructor TaxID=2066483 RepID=A0A345ZAS6_9BACT|nr:rod shape-determining protein MreC [Candidatus Chromulinivorax destructor]AXK60393.1 hypothetical protein C0J27_01350 [Candidatus Chromulinivorax destructor]
MQELGLKDWCVRFFFIFLFCFMINRLFFFSPGMAELSSSYVLYPILRVQRFFTDPITRYFTQKSNLAALHQDIAKLVLEKDDLQAQVIRLETTLNFEQCSQEIRDYATKYDFSGQQLAQVLLRSFDDAGHFYWVDAGLNKGISCNMIAVYKNNIIGRVIHVDPLYSKIALITDKRCKITAMCAQTKSVGIYEGNNSFAPGFDFVPHYETLQVGDLLISTGQGLVYPQGFAVGKILNFHIQDVAYKVTVQPLIDIKQLDFVYLIAV